jgi:hypothetical protein
VKNVLYTLELTIESDVNTTEKTKEVLYGTENVKNSMRLGSSLKQEVELMLAIDHTGPSLVVEIEGVKDSLLQKLQRPMFLIAKS